VVVLQPRRIGGHLLTAFLAAAAGVAGTLLLV
jgi:hypothetical protein